MNNNNIEKIVDTIFPERNFIYVGFWERLLALIIDESILIISCLVIYFALSSGQTYKNDVLFLFILACILVQWLYFAYFESSEMQATIGKQILKIKVTNIYGYRISFEKASSRLLGKIISSVFLFIGFFAVFFDNKKQAWHDKMTNTIVISAKLF